MQYRQGIALNNRSSNHTTTIGKEALKMKFKSISEKIVIGSAIFGGSAATTVGVVAAGSSATAAISAAGATVGGIAGGVFGSGVGLVSGGIGMAATVPFATGGAAIGSLAGPALAAIGIGTAPLWAVPVVVVGAMSTGVGLGIAAYKYAQSKKQK
jgi:hypothetical protein